MKKSVVIVLLFVLCSILGQAELFFTPQNLEIGAELLNVESLKKLFDADDLKAFLQSELSIVSIKLPGIEITVDEHAELKEYGEEAYLIDFQNDEKKIVANSKKGLLYAIDTLRDILDSQSEIYSFKLIDYPDYPIRGIIEGFYDKPWSHEDRLDILEFMGKYRLNTYVYAPKDDPYHRAQWKEPYPELEKNRLKELVDKANDNGVKFVFAISPGATIKFTSEEDFQTLIEKTEAMIALGIRDFAILWDDIDPTLKSKDDRVFYKNNYGLAHVEWNNRYQEYLRERLKGHKLLVVGTDYYQEGTSRYRDLYKDTLAEDILVFSTGYGVVAPRITKKHAEEIAEVWGSDIVYWDNYPVNDYARHRLYLGPLSGRDPKLPRTVGFTWNPMNEAELSKIALLTAASYGWNSLEYKPLDAWEKAIAILGGEQKELLRRFAINSITGLPGGATSNYPELKVLVDDFNSAFYNLVDNKENEDLQNSFREKSNILKEEFRKLGLLETEFMEYFPRAYAEASMYLKRLSNIGTAGLLIVEAIEDLVLSDALKAEELLLDGKGALNRDARFKEKEPSSISELLVTVNNLYRMGISLTN